MLQCEPQGRAPTTAAVQPVSSPLLPSLSRTSVGMGTDATTSNAIAVPSFDRTVLRVTSPVVIVTSYLEPALPDASAFHPVVETADPDSTIR